MTPADRRAARHDVNIRSGPPRGSAGIHALVRAGLTSGLVHQALCSCGYAGPPMLSKGHAISDGDDHLRAAGRHDDRHD